MVERFTVQHKIFGWQIGGDIRVNVRGNCQHYNAAMERFAAYEDTGLTPEEVKTLQEQAQQKKWCDYCKDADSNPYSDLHADEEFSRDNKFYFCPLCGRELDGGGARDSL